jgi:ABC-type nitrate/sulfonate/bicarbonate transport system substrate-binding protein
MGRPKSITLGAMVARALRFTAFGIALALPATIFAAEVLTLAIPTKSFQQVIYPLAQERGYMREEGIDLKITFIEPTPSIQALLAGSVQFTAAGSSALVAVAKAAAPLKTVLAVND